MERGLRWHVTQVPSYEKDPAGVLLGAVLEEFACGAILRPELFKGVMLSSLVNASQVFGSIDERLLECGVSPRSLLNSALL